MNNFAVLDIAYLHSTTHILITIHTNNPCHLTCYYTDKEPGRHRTARNQRGLTLPWGVYYCFVAWQSVEQTEPGDTLTHTFEIPAWSYCQTKYFAFRGTVASVLSPSVSCLFEHHHSGVLPALYEHYTVNDDTGHIVWKNLYQAQTFTPLTPHRITSVKLKLYRVGWPDTITVGIRETVAVYPTDTDLCIGTTWGNTLTLDPGGEWRDIEIVDAVNLSAGSQYAIVVRVSSELVLNYLVWRGDSTDPAYTRGEMLQSADYGNTWTRVPLNDFMFEEWGIAI